MPWPKGKPHTEVMIRKMRESRCGNLRPLEDRFWERVSTGGEDDCWEWLGAKLPSGYGKLNSKSGESYAHRLSWKIAHGSIPAGMSVLHRCDNRSCVNPRHLFVGTQADNLADMRQKGRGFIPDSSRGNNGRAKLTEGQVREISEKYDAGDTSYAILAREFNVHKSTIAYAVRGLHWRDA